MSLIAAWLALPLLLAALAVGCGLLVERLAGARLPGASIPGAGLAVLIVAATLAMTSPATAAVALPLVGALALAGFGLAGAGRLRDLDPWAVAAPLAVFAVYAVPILATGTATFAGYTRLDDTATWLAMTERIAEHGRSVTGLEPSTHEATLALNLGEGYPIGAFAPLAATSRLIGEDVAWLFQPYMAFLAATLAAALWVLVAPLVADRRLRAAVVFVAAQPALLYGYYLWGGVKEVAAAALLATVAALVAIVVRERFSERSMVPAAIAAAALVAVLSPGGVIWLLPAIALVGAVGVRRVGVRTLARRAALPALAAALLSSPALAAGILPPTAAPLTGGEATGNLGAPLSIAQGAGIWPAGDFRLEPAARPLVAILIGLAVAAALAGALVALRRRAWPLLAFVVASLLSGAAIAAFGSPWAAGKALATASPAIPVLTGAAAALLLEHRRRLAGAALLVAIAAGVLWSNALAHRDAALAPRDQLAELELIGERISGRGPALITEYQPYGARHFLREADPEAPSELRRRTVPLRGGGTAATGESPDTDELALRGLLVYPTLVLRRSPARSRPPSSYELTFEGRHYEVWEQRSQAGRIAGRLPLGEGPDPGGRPPCAQVGRLAALAGAGGSLVAAPAPELAIAAPTLPRPGAVTALRVEVETPGDYEIWLRGSIASRVAVGVDGRAVGAVRHRLNAAGQYVRLGIARMLRPGEHDVELRVDGPGVAPGSGAAATEPATPLVLARVGPRDPDLTRIDAGEAGRLCGRRWDWIEAVRAPADGPPRR